MRHEKQHTKKKNEAYTAFLNWWFRDGVYIDPDAEVDWHEKRRELAYDAWKAAIAAAKEQG